ncbi:Early light-induced protein 1 [Ranunculus cassubicifolius]
MAEEKVPEQPTPATTPSPPAAAPKVKKVTTGSSNVLAFGGPGPERINGRLAMIGFVAAIGAELAKGDDLVAQLANGGLPWFVGTSVVLLLASLVPLFKGISVESKSEGLMTSNAEMLNGRFAMLGLVALVCWKMFSEK